MRPPVGEAIVGLEPLDARAAAVLTRRIGGHSLQIAWRRAWGARERRSEGKQGGEQEEPHRRLLNTDALRLTLLQLQPPSNYKSVTLPPLPCYLLPKTNFLRFNLPLKTHKGDKCDLDQDTPKGGR